MDDDTGDVVAFNVIQVSEVTSSNVMEKEGFSRCIELLTVPLRYTLTVQTRFIRKYAYEYTHIRV